MSGASPELDHVPRARYLGRASEVLARRLQHPLPIGPGPEMGEDQAGDPRLCGRLRRVHCRGQIGSEPLRHHRRIRRLGQEDVRFRRHDGHLRRWATVAGVGEHSTSGREPDPCVGDEVRQRVGLGMKGPDREGVARLECGQAKGTDELVQSVPLEYPVDGSRRCVDRERIDVPVLEDPRPQERMEVGIVVGMAVAHVDGVDGDRVLAEGGRHPIAGIDQQPVIGVVDQVTATRLPIRRKGSRTTHDPQAHAPPPMLQSGNSGYGEPMSIRTFARTLLAGIFVVSGWEALQDPRTGEQIAEEAVPLADKAGLPTDPARMVKLNGAVQFGAGVLMMAGWMPRLAALALAASLVPTTYAAHRFWEIDDPAERRTQLL